MSPANEPTIHDSKAASKVARLAVCVRIHKWVDDALEMEAERLQVRKGHLIEQAIRRYLNLKEAYDSPSEE